ncbi:hypothetical protein ILUMI_16067, partial [Ignelater luminosus]
MKTAVLNSIENMSLDVQNCRGQSYDNASNMPGHYSGLQARTKKKIVNFFLAAEEIYIFFLASTYRREIMKESLTRNKTADGPVQLVPKRLSATRWSARFDACTVLYNSCDAFKEALEVIVADSAQSPKTKTE